MTLIELTQTIRRLDREHRKKIFSLKEIAAFAGVSRPAAGMSLLRAEKKGLVGRTRNYWINLTDPPTAEELALTLASPSYISFESALYHHQVLSQSPRVLTVATRGRPRRLETPLGIIQLIHLKPGLFFGYDENRTASAEKAWLDLLYVRGRMGWKETAETFYFDRLNRKKLSVLAKKFPGWVMKRHWQMLAAI